MSQTPDPQQLGSTSCNETQKARKPVARTFNRKKFQKVLEQFSRDFNQPDGTGTTQTLREDIGIGPVSYDIKFPPGMAIHEKKLLHLNRLVKAEKVRGDAMIQFVADILCLVDGTEKPDKIKLALSRVATRIQLREQTDKLRRIASIAKDKNPDVETFLPYFEKTRSLPNAIEMRHMHQANRYHQTNDHVSFKSLNLHMVHRIIQRKKQRLFVAFYRKVMNDTIDHGPGLKFGIADEQEKNAIDAEKQKDDEADTKKDESTHPKH